MKILVTGASGFIGRRLVKELLAQKHELYLLTRPQSSHLSLALFGSSPQVTYIDGDIEDTDVLKKLTSVARHIDEIDCVVHLAALYDLRSSLSESYMKNVIGTQNIISLLKKMKKVTHFHYFSTYAVNTFLKGICSENRLSKDEFAFPDEYTRTKNEAEHIVRERTPKNINVVIHRPGVLIGDSETGEIDKIDGPYYFFDFIRKLKMAGPVAARLPVLPMPLNSQSLLPVLPIDLLVEWSATIISHPPDRKLTCYHLLSQELISTKNFLEEGMRIMGVPAKIIPIKFQKIFPPLFPLLKMPEEIIFYMNQAVVFERTQLQNDYPQFQAPPFREYLPRIIAGYLKDRT